VQNLCPVVLVKEKCFDKIVRTKNKIENKGLLSRHDFIQAIGSRGYPRKGFPFNFQCDEEHEGALTLR
jgi:hypothetical protein